MKILELLTYGYIIVAVIYLVAVIFVTARDGDYFNLSFFEQGVYTGLILLGVVLWFITIPYMASCAIMDKQKAKKELEKLKSKQGK